MLNALAIAGKVLDNRPVKNTKGAGAKPTRKTAGGSRIYTLDVYLVDGPMAETYATQKIISRQIDIHGD